MAALAHHLIYRVADPRLMAHGALSPDIRAGLEQVLRAGPPLNPQGNSFEALTLPASQPVRADSGPSTMLAAAAMLPLSSPTIPLPTPGTEDGPGAPAQLRRCIRTGCSHYGITTTSPWCLSCGTATQRIHQ